MNQFATHSPITAFVNTVLPFPATSINDYAAIFNISLCVYRSRTLPFNHGDALGDRHAFFGAVASGHGAPSTTGTARHSPILGSAM
jgi:hypothetical protein